MAGLASTEDFTAISLKSSADPMNISWLPYKPIMLLHIKGRRNVQIRLVEPAFNSLNQGDCFILVAEEMLYSFIGRSANVIEKAHCKDIITQILRDKDLGCSAATSNMINEKNLDSFNGKAFCKILGRGESQELDKLTDAGHNDEDELFEACLLETNKIYELVDDDSLVPIAEYWGTIPTISMLNSEKVLVFDFGSELYVWNGRNAMPAAKNLALQLAEEMFSLKYDYEMCDLCPINYAELVGHRKSEKIHKSGSSRPKWCLFGKVSQNMETVVFREKFKDWPDIKIHFKHSIVNCNEIQKIDGTALFNKQSYEEPNLILDGANLGRGNFYYDPETRRHFDVIQVSVNKWHTTDKEIHSENQKAHFYANECYSVKFIYQMNITVRELTGKVSDRGTVGRDRCVIFDWQGKNSSATERGAIALQSIELNKEKGAQMVIEQGYELPTFVRLFKIMYIHRNRTDESRFQKWRMYLITG